MINYYEILGLSTNASVNDIKNAYRKKAKEYHPDISVLHNAHKLFIEVTEAYEYLIKLKTISKTRTETGNKNYSEQWDRYERPHTTQKAEQFSKMKYNDFKKTQYYKATKLAMEIYLYASMGIGVIIVVSSIYGFMDDFFDATSTAQKISGDVIIFIVGLIFFLFSIFQLFERKKTNAI